MSAGLQLSQRLSQQMVLSPQLQHSLALLQAPVLELKAMAEALFELTSRCQAAGWSAEELLRAESQRRESAWRRAERRNSSR